MTWIPLKTMSIGSLNSSRMSSGARASVWFVGGTARSRTAWARTLSALSPAAAISPTQPMATASQRALVGGQGIWNLPHIQGRAVAALANVDVAAPRHDDQASSGTRYLDPQGATSSRLARNSEYRQAGDHHAGGHQRIGNAHQRRR